VRIALDLARANAGKSIAANMAMMAMTTNSSIKVNAGAPRRGDSLETITLCSPLG
jgi:hypothetical protein